ncbi:hypothetical protein C0989_004863 [Termitomyces sp. Mn162]|nr:hypothetical protein C0989_004863 [Termitomyces sp. Mn162]
MERRAQGQAAADDPDDWFGNARNIVSETYIMLANLDQKDKVRAMQGLHASQIATINVMIGMNMNAIAIGAGEMI